MDKEIDSQDKELSIVDIKKCIYPTEAGRFWLAVVVVLPITLLFIFFTVGIGLLIVPLFLFMSWFTTKILRANLLGSCAEISEDNFPEVHALLKQVCHDLDYDKKLEIFTYQDGEVNSLLIKLFRTKIILLPHGLLANMLEGKGKVELIWILGRAVGHLKAKHLSLWGLRVLIESFEKLFILNIFLYPWERATQYSGDRIGLAICSDLSAATRAMNKFMLGNELADKTTLLGALKQKQKLRGSFFAWLAECLSTHPHLTNRIASLISWSKEYNAVMYEKFMSRQKNREEIESLLS